jgi:hypothetical protein
MRYVTLILLCSTLQITSCKKDKKPENIDLADAHLATVKKYAEGRFSLLFIKGGFSGGTRYYNDRGYNLVNDQFTWIVADTIQMTSTTEWFLTKDIETGKSVYAIKYQNQYGTDESLAVLRVDSGRLVMSSNGFDGGTFYFSRKP